MAKYQVMFWKHIPAQVKAWDESGEVKRMLPDRFQAAIDAYAMKDGSTGMDAYLEAWSWGDEGERAGSPEYVSGAVVKECDGAICSLMMMETSYVMQASGISPRT